MFKKTNFFNCKTNFYLSSKRWKRTKFNYQYFVLCLVYILNIVQCIHKHVQYCTVRTLFIFLCKNCPKLLNNVLSHNPFPYPPPPSLRQTWQPPLFLDPEKFAMHPPSLWKRRRRRGGEAWWKILQRWEKMPEAGGGRGREGPRGRKGGRGGPTREIDLSVFS